MAQTAKIIKYILTEFTVIPFLKVFHWSILTLEGWWIDMKDFKKG